MARPVRKAVLPVAGSSPPIVAPPTPIGPAPPSNSLRICKRPACAISSPALKWVSMIPNSTPARYSAICPQRCWCCNGYYGCSGVNFHILQRGEVAGEVAAADDAKAVATFVKTLK